MDITIGLIYYRLSLISGISIELYNNLSNNIQIKNCFFYNHQKTETYNLYIINEKDLLEDFNRWEGYSLICITSQDEHVNLPLYDLITVEPTVDLLYLCNQIQLIFQSFRDWKDEIREIRKTACDLNEILNASQVILPYTFSIVDDEFNFIAKTADFFKRYPNFMDTPDRISLDIANEFFSEEEFKYAKEHKNVFEYEAKSPVRTDADIGLCYNIFIDGSYYARLTVEVSRRDNMSGERYFVKCIGEIITEICSEPNSQKSYEKDYMLFQETIRHFTKGLFQDRNTVIRILHKRRWLPEHQYQVLKFNFERKGYIFYYCKQIEQVFGNCCAVHAEDGIYCIRNLSLLNSREDKEIGQRFSTFIRDNLCKVGISNVFQDIFQVFTYCQEADIALKVGEKIDKQFWHYNFSRYTMNYIIDQSTSILPAYNICHNAVKVLKKYDQKNNTELFLTLYELIKCKYNITHTAKALFIHRTTLVQRINRIKQLTDVNLDDYNQCLHLMLSYYLLNNNFN